MIEAMSDARPASRFELDERDPRLFRRPQERALVLKRPRRPDLKLTVMLAYVEGAFRARVNGAYSFVGIREKPDPMEMPPEERAAIERLVRDYFKAEAFDEPRGGAQVGSR